MIAAGCGKPEFFIKRKALFEVHTETGMLYNTDGGTPMVPIGEEDLPSPNHASTAPRGLGDHAAGDKCRVFQGGFYQDLHKMLDISSGGEVSAMSHPPLRPTDICVSLVFHTGIWWRSECFSVTVIYVCLVVF